MFGIPAYAATPFAALAGNSFSFAVVEDIGAADSSTQLSAFLQTIAQDITMADTPNDAGVSYSDGVVETLTFGDSSTQQSAFLQVFSGGVTQADAPEIAAQFAVSLSENTTLASLQEIYSAFFFDVIENFSPNTALTIIRVFTDSIAEAITMADANSSTSNHPATITENVNMASSQTDVGWIKIPTTQSVTWTIIETSQ